MPMLEMVPLNRKKIRNLREARGWSLARAATEAGMSNRQQWEKVEAGRVADPSISTVERMARALGVGIDELMADDDMPAPPPTPTDDDRLSQEIEELARRAAEE